MAGAVPRPSFQRGPPHLPLPIIPTLSDQSMRRLTPPSLRRSSSPAVQETGCAHDDDGISATQTSSRRMSTGTRLSGSGRGGSGSRSGRHTESRNLSIFPSRRRGSPSARRTGNEILRRVLQRRGRYMHQDLQNICLQVFDDNNTVDELMELCYQGDLEKIHYLLVDRMQSVMDAVKEHDSRILRRQDGTSDIGGEDSGGEEPNAEEDMEDSEDSSQRSARGAHTISRPICIDEQVFENTLTEFLAVLWYTCLPVVAEDMNANQSEATRGQATTALLDDAEAARKGGGISVGEGRGQSTTAGSESGLGSAAQDMSPGRGVSRGKLPSMGNIKQKCRRIIQESRHTRRRRRGAKKGRGCYGKIKRLLPWRVRFVIGREVVGSADRWSEIQYTTLERKALWRTFGQPTHWFTLEYTDDASLEKGFQVDFAIRARKYPYWNSFLVVACVMLYVWLRFEINKTDSPSVTFVRQFMSEPAVLIIFAALIRLVIEVIFFDNSLWFIENYYVIQGSMGALCGTGVILWMYIAPLALSYYTWKIQEALTFAVLIAALGGLFKLRYLLIVFLGLYFFVCIVSMRWIAMSTPALPAQLFTDAAPDVLLYIGSVAVVATVRYMYESLCRKDYVLSLTLATEADRSERLLSNVLPGSIIRQLKENQDDQIRQEAQLARRGSEKGGSTVADATVTPSRRLSYQMAVGFAEAYDSVSILFSDVVLEDPSIVDDCGLVDHLGRHLRIRVGMHSGHCVAGVIGRKKFIYDVWGDCVNTASRMESHGAEMRVHCTAETARELRGSFDLTCRGEIEIKGKGKMVTYFVDREREHSRLRDYSGYTYYSGTTTVGPSTAQFGSDDNDDDRSDRGLLAIPEAGDRTSPVSEGEITRRRLPASENPPRRVTIAGI
ncbi:Nitrogen permease regulator 2 [Perkinsus chesapeaki]|uniref:Nitrogen permease regulator 2 n=1 Tax=Perkinsus chesapeaki TaxID=330153 RepID=A0A7J6LUI7_PERCH|nr:Nitrogen permease regulator 2 [Perkinsus chesapeaki]